MVSAALSAQEASTPVFKGGVERVALAAIVRDERGKLVTNLSDRDFELFDSGHRKPLIGVWSEASPASVALLLDASGSMATKFERAREASRDILAGLTPGFDEAALYSFDTELKELRPFSKTFSSSDEAWAGTKAFGATSLWDAVGETARRIADRQQRRALIVITDGVDSASRMKPSQVSAIASSLEVPVYIVVVSLMAEEVPAPVSGPLADLATWTGGILQVIRDPISTDTATRHILAELQHQYVIAFEPGSAPGWHPLVLRTKKQGMFVRARNGYIVGAGQKN